VFQKINLLNFKITIMIKKNYPVFEKAQRYEIAQMVHNAGSKRIISRRGYRCRQRDLQVG
ncbi:hypothetical protein ACIXFX_24835, partial [Bacteroides fragilis]